MSVSTRTALRVLVPNDLRLVARDGLFLSAMVVVLPLAGLGLRWLLPLAADLVREWVALETYFALILAATLVAGQPVMLGFVLGVLFVEERDQGTLAALRTSPLSLRRLLGYRLLVAMLLNVVLTTLALALAGLVAVPLAPLLAAAALASLAVPIVALTYATFVKNKVQALMLLKPMQTWSMLPALLFFVPAPWPWIGSVVAPLYYPMRLFTSAADGAADWWLLMPGSVLCGLATAWLWQRFERDDSAR